MANYIDHHNIDHSIKILSLSHAQFMYFVYVLRYQWNSNVSGRLPYHHSYVKVMDTVSILVMTSITVLRFYRFHSFGFRYIDLLLYLWFDNIVVVYVSGCVFFKQTCFGDVYIKL